MSSGKVLLGVLAGIAVGATLGILFAPDKGKSTRKKIASKSDDYAQELGEKFNELIGSITDKFESVRQEAVRKVKKGKHNMEEVEAEVSQAME